MSFSILYQSFHFDRFNSRIILIFCFLDYHYIIMLQYGLQFLHCSMSNNCNQSYVELFTEPQWKRGFVPQMVIVPSRVCVLPCSQASVVAAINHVVVARGEFMQWWSPLSGRYYWCYFSFSFFHFLFYMGSLFLVVQLYKHRFVSI